MKPIPLFVELCAGLASVSGCLQHGARWKPPVSRMGRKTGYAEAILDVMGLRPGQGARGYVWAEADSDVAALLAAYTQPEAMREIASIIRSWIPCPYGPHAPDPSCSRCKGTGRWDARDLWEVLRREKRRGLWEGGGEAGEVAGWAFVQGNNHPSKQDGRPIHQWAFKEGYNEDAAHTREGMSSRFRAPLWPPVTLTPDAAIQPAHIPPGTVVYMDPPYAGTTGYKHDLPRAAVVKIAQRWLDAGARVYISEAEPIAIPGWHHVEITGERRGQARTFGATREWLTCSDMPRRRQVGLFGRAA